MMARHVDQRGVLRRGVFVLALVALLDLGRGAEQSSGRARFNALHGGSGAPSESPATQKSRTRPPVLVLDIDGTLYGSAAQVESQIVAAIHRYGADVWGLDAAACDELHREHGSTIAGMQHRAAMGGPSVDVADFYRRVYENLDYTRLGTPVAAAAVRKTGYSSVQKWGSLLAAIAARHPVWLATNSPSTHALSVLRALGLGPSRLPIVGILAPDVCGWHTKSDGAAYYKRLLEKHPLDQWQLHLMDDSPTNLVSARGIGFTATRIRDADTATDADDSDGFELGYALAAFAGLVPRPDEWRFDAVSYLQSKALVDAAARSPEVWKQVAAAVEEREAMYPGNELRVLEIGAGLLPLLSAVAGLQGHFETVHYAAFESNAALLPACEKVLVGFGLELAERYEHKAKSGLAVQVQRWVRPPREGTCGGMTVSLCLGDITSPEALEAVPAVYRRSADVVGGPNLIVGSCVVDLFEPEVLAATLTQLAGDDGALAYLPITFIGRTALEPALAVGVHVDGDGGGAGTATLSDSEVFRAYHEALALDQGHHLDPRDVVKALAARYGVAQPEQLIVTEAASQWAVDPDANAYMWESLLHFVGQGIAPRLLAEGFGIEEVARWVDSVRQRGAIWKIGNTDLLLRLPPSHAEAAPPPAAADDGTGGAATGNFLWFVGPRELAVRQETLEDLGPTQLLLVTECSLISSGTELKVWRGDFEAEPGSKTAAIDLTIDGMDSETMAFPLKYGYSLVGRVLHCGEALDTATWQGRRVFAFAPHGSHAIVDAGAALLVPEGVSAEDAAFFPAVETALSLVQDANPVVGEHMAVVGLGMIGLLVTATLSHGFGGAAGGVITAVEPQPARRAVAAGLRGVQPLEPSAVQAAAAALAGPAGAGGFDVTIEVSGVARGLQTALDYTGRGGRLVLGSWYGDKPLASPPLLLGLDFHRSKLDIKVSQVSEIRAALSGRWDKARRFGATWALLKQLRPARLLAPRAVALSDAGGAYAALDTGAELALVIKYDAA